MVVEFIGVAGAGKTSLATRVCSLLASDRRTVTRREFRPALRSRETVRVVPDLGRLLRHAPVSLVRHERGRELLRVAAQHAVAARRYAGDDGIAVLDEGPVHETWRAAMAGLPPRRASRLAADVARSVDLIVHLRPPPGVARQRLVTRTTSGPVAAHFTRADDSDRAWAYARYEPLAAAATRQTNALTVGGADLDRDAQAVVASINRLLPPPTGTR